MKEIDFSKGLPLKARYFLTVTSEEPGSVPKRLISLWVKNDAIYQTKLFN